jgi:phage terminase large subunit
MSDLAFLRAQGITLLPAQEAFVDASERFVAFIGGVGSGKTVAGACKAIAYALEHPGAVGLVGAPNRTVLRDVTQRALFDLLPPEYIASFHQSTGELILTNGSEILLRSLDDFDHRRGLNLAFVWLDEAILCGYEAWQVIKARLRQREMPPQAWITSTPHGQDRFYRDFEAAPLPDHRLIRARTADNPYLPQGYAESLGYTGTFALQELDGLFVARSGQVYRLRPENVAPAPPPDELVDVVGGIDWGYRNPLHLSVIARSGATALLVAEFRAVEADLLRSVVPAVIELTRQFAVATWYAGPERPENIQVVGGELHAAGLASRVVPADDRVVAGIETVRSMLESQPPALVIDPGCQHTLAEIADYRYPDPASLPVDAPAPEHPIKINDHALDALRYAVHSHYGPLRQARRFSIHLTWLNRKGDVPLGP